MALEKRGNKRYMSFAVFLDVDGVLNTRKTVISSPDGHIGVDDARIEILAGAIEKYGGGDIVLTSDWKNVRIGGDLDYLRDKLMGYNLEISAVTKEHWNKRGQEGKNCYIVVDVIQKTILGNYILDLDELYGSGFPHIMCKNILQNSCA